MCCGLVSIGWLYLGLIYLPFKYINSRFSVHSSRSYTCHLGILDSDLFANFGSIFTIMSGDDSSCKFVQVGFQGLWIQPLMIAIFQSHKYFRR